MTAINRRTNRPVQITPDPGPAAPGLLRCTYGSGPATWRGVLDHAVASRYRVLEATDDERAGLWEALSRGGAEPGRGGADLTRP